MHSVHNSHSNNTHCYIAGGKVSNEPVHVIEIGHGFHPYSYSPQKKYRNYFALHYVLHGQVTYRAHTMNAPCMFILPPNRLHFYKTDNQTSDCTPFEQYWITFAGDDAERQLKQAGFSNDPKPLSCPEIQEVCNILSNMQKESTYIGENDHYMALSALYHLFSLHRAVADKSIKGKKGEAVVYTILNYIKSNYATIQSIEELSALVHLSYTQMYKLFKATTGVSPLHYLNSYRIHCAKTLLNQQSLTIYEIAEAVGYSDPNYFCNVFRKFNKGISPSEYRKKPMLNEKY